MSSSSHSRSPTGHVNTPPSRASNGKQPAVEHDYDDDDEALLADDPLEHDLPEQYARPPPSLNF